MCNVWRDRDLAWVGHSHEKSSQITHFQYSLPPHTFLFTWLLTQPCRTLSIIISFTIPIYSHNISQTLNPYQMASLNSYPSLLLSLLFLSLNIITSTQLPCPPSPLKLSPKPSPKPQKGSCPRDTVKLGVCSDLLGGLLDITVGQPPKKPCCSFLEGLTDAEAAACLCTAVKKLPSGFLCP